MVRVPVYTSPGVSGAFAQYGTESVFVVEERKTYPHGMARHGTRIGAAYMCDLSRSPTTEDSEDFESVYRKSEDGVSRMRCVHRVYVRMSY